MSYTTVFSRVLAICRMLGERRPAVIQSYVDHIYQGKIPEELRERYEKDDPSLAGIKVILSDIQCSAPTTIHR